MIWASLRRNVVIILMSVSYCYYRSESCDPTLTRPEHWAVSRPPRHVRINPELPELEHRVEGRRGKHSFIYKWVSRQVDNSPGNSGNIRSSEPIVNGCPDLRYENIALWHHQWPCPRLWGWGAGTTNTQHSISRHNGGDPIGHITIRGTAWLPAFMETINWRFLNLSNLNIYSWAD